MTTEEIERMALTTVIHSDGQRMRAEDDDVLLPMTDGEILARFILRAIPVLRAAEAWDASRSDEKAIALCQALDAFRSGDK